MATINRDIHMKKTHKYDKDNQQEKPDIDQLIKQTEERIDDSKRQYIDKVTDVDYQLTSEDYLEKMLKEASSFNYDLNADPLFRQYRDIYEKESELSAKNIFGLASALTGGYGNSYAASAVSSVVGDYLDKLTAKGQQLSENAYEKHRDRLNDYYTAYKEYGALAKAEDEKEDKAKAEEKAIADAFEKLAFDAADAGDYSFLEKLGINTDNLKNRDEIKKAELFAKYGDYSGLEKMGFDITNLNKEEQYELARLFASYGDYSLLNLLGADTKNQEQEDYYNRILLWARYLKALR